MVLVDLPQGSKFGFPKPLPAEITAGVVIKKWLLNQGYPQELIESGLANLRLIGPENEVNAITKSL